jgi:hypothetical protein
MVLPFTDSRDDAARAGAPDGRGCRTSGCHRLGWEPVHLAGYRTADLRVRTFLVVGHATVTGPAPAMRSAFRP